MDIGHVLTLGGVIVAIAALLFAVIKWRHANRIRFSVKLTRGVGGFPGVSFWSTLDIDVCNIGKETSIRDIKIGDFSANPPITWTEFENLENPLPCKLSHSD